MERSHKLQKYLCKTQLHDIIKEVQDFRAGMTDKNLSEELGHGSEFEMQNLKVQGFGPREKA